MLYITGDTHGMQFKWVEQIEKVLSPGDTLIICGDFGVGFWNGRYWSEETFFDYLAEQPYCVLFVDGNHEDFNKLDRYPVEMWNGGRVHKLRPNLIHLMRGEIYTIEGDTFFAMGGGYSLDKARRVEGYSWWPQEMPTEEEYRRAEQNLASVNHRVDYIITHTAPSETVYCLSCRKNLGITCNVPEELPLNTFLDEVQRSTEYKHWYFGHFHVDEELWRSQTAVLSTVRELTTGRIVRSWEAYEGK